MSLNWSDRDDRALAEWAEATPELRWEELRYAARAERARRLAEYTPRMEWKPVVIGMAIGLAFWTAVRGVVWLARRWW